MKTMASRFLYDGNHSGRLEPSLLTSFDCELGGLKAWPKNQKLHPDLTFQKPVREKLNALASRAANPPSNS